MQVNAHSLEEVSLDRAFGVVGIWHLGELREFLVELRSKAMKRAVKVMPRDTERRGGSMFS